MRNTLLLSLFFLLCRAQAAPVTIRLVAPAFADQEVLLYRQLDLFTPRTALLARARLDAQGVATLTTDVEGTVKAALVVSSVRGELWLRPGTYDLRMPAPKAGAPRSVNGTTKVDLTFNDLSPLDVNALVSDLNERLDGFLAEDLATDSRSGMEAVQRVRSGQAVLTPDTAKKRPKTLFISPTWSASRVDSFAGKLRRFYADVKDPWFQQDVEYGIAGLYLGPRNNDRDLYEAYLKGQPVLCDVPEYVRFVGAFFEDHLMQFPFRSDELRLTNAITSGVPDSVLAVLRKHDFLRDEPQLSELVMLQQLYVQYSGKTFDRAGILAIVKDRAERSPYPEHRTIAANIVWDLTAMRPTATLPSLVLRDAQGEQVTLDSLLHGPTCIVLTANWCAYCEQELVGLEALYAEYGTYVRFIGIDLDPSPGALKAYVKAHPARNWTWLSAGDDPTVMDALRARSIPSFFLLNDRTLAYSPAPPPSNGLAAVLHKVKADADERNRLKPDVVDPRPKRR
ncbi:MAG TPA: TlpA disulfide reductase family protein [Flavobacteriales bacterium]|nr:TlpA disulfide reductase family protein [Flavobacteriales bacterium]